MEDTKLSRYSVSFGLALALASVMNAVLVVAKERNPLVLAWMKGLTGHHWVTQTAVVVVLFLAVGFGLAAANGGKGLKLTIRTSLAILMGGVILGGLIIIGFYCVVG